MTHQHTPAVQTAIVAAINTVGTILVGTSWDLVTESPVPDEDIDVLLNAPDSPFARPTCSICRRERDIARPMDSYDYNPLQVITNQNVGWYSGDDGQVCPECMTETLRRQA